MYNGSVFRGGDMASDNPQGSGSNSEPRFDPATGRPLGEPMQPDSGAHLNNHMEEIPPKMSFGDKLMNIFIEPSSVFKNLYYHNDWLTPLIFTGALNIIAGIILLPWSSSAREQFNELMNVPTTGAAATVGNITQYVTLLMGPVGLMFGWLVAAAILFVLGTFLLENVDFKKLYSIAAFVTVPVAFTQLISAVSRMGKTPVISSYDDFIDASMPWTISLGRVISLDGIAGKLIDVYDVFAIWSYWLLFLAISYGLRNKKQQSALLTIIYAVLSLGLAIGMFALQAKFRPPGV
jgi:hypothetical protein